MDTRSQVEQVIQKLEEISKVHRIYFGPRHPPVVNFLRGFTWGHDPLIDHTKYHKIYREVQVDLGWATESAHGPTKKMLEHGLDDDAIAKEYLAIELETWRRILKDLEQE